MGNVIVRRLNILLLYITVENTVDKIFNYEHNLNYSKCLEHTCT